MWALGKAAWMRWHHLLPLKRHVGVSQAERRSRGTPDREVWEQPAQGHRATTQGQPPELQIPPLVTAAWEGGGRRLKDGAGAAARGPCKPLSKLGLHPRKSIERRAASFPHGTVENGLEDDKTRQEDSLRVSGRVHLRESKNSVRHGC